MTFIRLAFLAFILSACIRLDNQIHYVRLVCGSELSLPDPEFSLYRFRDAAGQTIDLSEVSYDVLGEGFVSVPGAQYRLTSSGCLQVGKQQNVFVRLPLRGEASPTLRDQDGLSEVQLILDKAPPTITLPVIRSNFRIGETLDVRVNEASRTRYCVDAPGEERCALQDGPRLAFESPSFLDFDGNLPLPKAEGAYRLSVVAEDRSGLTGIFLQNFTVDSTIPVVDVDFSQAESFLFDGKSHFYLDQGYRLGFRSKNKPLSQVTIEYCLVSSKKGEIDSCEPESIRVFGVENPGAVLPGAWTLLYRATDRAGNRAEGWDRLRILAKSTCTEHELLAALDQPGDFTCTELVGDLSVNRVAVENYERLRTLVGISGKISLIESDRETVPSFPNLRRLTKLEIRENYELLEINMLPSLVSVEDINIFDNEVLVKLSGFDRLTSLRNLTVSVADDALEIQAFSALKTIEGKLSVTDIGGLKDLSFLKAIEYMDSIHLSQLVSMASLTVLSSGFIKSSIGLFYMPSLADLHGLENLRSLRDLTILNLGIASFVGLENLERVEGELQIHGNSKLISFDGFRSLRLVGNLKIEENDGLKEIDWQAPAEQISHISIKENDALTSIKGFDRLTGIDAPIVSIVNNAELKEIAGWKNLTEISFLSILDNKRLETIEFAAGLKALHHSIKIQRNGELKSLQGFGGLNEQPNLDIVVRAKLDPSKNSLSSYTSSQDM